MNHSAMRGVPGSARHGRGVALVWRLLLLVLVVGCGRSAVGQELVGAVYQFDRGEHRPLAIQSPFTVVEQPILDEGVTVTFRFDQPVVSFSRVTAGTLPVGFVSQIGNDLSFRITSMQDGRYYPIGLQNVKLEDGTILSGVSLAIGFLAGDFDASGEVSVSDLLIYLAAFWADDLRIADVDRSGSPTIDDLLYALIAYFDGNVLENMPPIMAPIQDVQVVPGEASERQPLYLDDDQFIPASLSLEAVSGDPGVIPSEDVLITYDDGEAYVQVLTNAPIGSSVSIVLLLSDGVHEVAQQFVVSVRLNSPPRVRMRATTYWGRAPLTVQFDATSTTDADQDDLNHIWAVDGSIAFGDRLTHTFEEPGEYSIRLTTLDAMHGPQEIERTVTVVSGAYDVNGPVSRLEARRFLWQAAFGPRESDVDFIAANGYEAWIDQQMLLSASAFSPVMQAPLGELEGEEPRVDSLLDDYWIEAPDQLRHRMVFALSQVLVINTIHAGSGPQARWTTVRPYMDHAFGNYRDLLEDVTFTKSMAVYLTYHNNQLADNDRSTFPDENYAREIMQLFTIGLWELHRDGSLRLDASGRPIPTFTNTDVEEFARVFTGLHNTISGDLGFELPLIMRDDWHDFHTKQLLAYPQAIPALGVLPASVQSPENGVADVQSALDNLFYHPNCAPFLSRLLIMRFTSSNPSPAYVDRVASTFEDNGVGVRGDLSAVLKAILLDPEARDPAYRSNPAYGKRMEPLIAYYGVLGALGHPADRPGEPFPYRYNVHPEDFGQYPWRSPSVFNFYQPDYAPSNTDVDKSGLVAPELQIFNTATSAGGHNHFRRLLRADNARYADWLSDASGDPAIMLDAAFETFSHRDLSPEAEAIMLNALGQIPPESWEYAAPRFAASLIVFSPEFMILR